MSVLGWGDAVFMAYIKGAPEQIKKYCDMTSIPDDYEVVLDFYARKGYRVLSLACNEMNEKLKSSLD